MNRINLICLGVKDMAKSLAFYKSIGFVTYEKSDCPPVVFFDSQGSKLELFSIEGLAKDINAQNPPEISAGGFCGVTMSCTMKSEAEVDSFFAKIEELGVTIAKMPEKVFWGGYSGYFQDPDGYYWEVAYGPNWKFDDRDMLIVEEE